MLNAPVATEWLAEASPKLHTAIASAGHGDATRSFAARSMANATPTARGRCDAIVEVCGMIARSWRPNTLWRPPEIGSLVAATTPARMSLTPVQAGAAEIERRRCGSAAGPGRSDASPWPGSRCSRDRPSRSCSSPCPAIAATAPRGRCDGWPAARRTGGPDRARPGRRVGSSGWRGSTAASRSTSCCSRAGRVRSTPSTISAGPTRADEPGCRSFDPFSLVNPWWSRPASIR